MKIASLIRALCAILLVGGCGGGEDGTTPASKQVETVPTETFAVARVETRIASAQAPQAQVDPLRRRGSRPPPTTVQLGPPPTTVQLGPLPAGQRAADMARMSATPGTPLKIGTGRPVAATADANEMGNRLVWHADGEGGLSAAIRFASQDAASLRVGIQVRRLPASATVRGYVGEAETVFEVAGTDIISVLQRNSAAGDVGNAAHTWWTPPVDGPEVTVEIALPPGVPAEAVEVLMPLLSHLYLNPNVEAELPKVGEAASCEVDVSCTAVPDTLGRSTARMIFVNGADTFACTGTLLNDVASSGTPYFLSANHCISSQTVASTLITNWFYRSTSCNSGKLDTTITRQVTGGATLLYASATTDTSFMRLNKPAPDGAVFAGWSSDVPAIGVDVVGVHHPAADLQKFSQGALSAFFNCVAGEDDSFRCSGASASTGKFVNAGWTSGTTEGGSSGSGLFAAIGGRRYLVGQLYGGSSSCKSPAGSNVYGRFDIAYATALGRWLGASGPVVARTAVYRFYNPSTGAHFFTADVGERDQVGASNSSFLYEGIAFYAYGSYVAGTSPVYRFYNTRTGRHFYTINIDERDYVLSTLHDYAYEGPRWFAQPSADGGAGAIYRFYNAKLDTHFYTASAAESDYITHNNRDYAPEGVGFYAWGTQ